MTGDEILPGTFLDPPREGRLQFTLEYDGKIQVFERGELREQIILPAKTPYQLGDLRRGTEIRVFIGLDLVWSISYKKTQSLEEKEILEKLRRAGGELLSLSHELAAVSREFKDCPALSRYLRQRKREGGIRRGEARILRSLIAKKKVPHTWQLGGGEAPLD